MGSNHAHLIVADFAGFIENLGGDHDLADIVDETGYPKAFDAVRSQARLLGQSQSQPGDPPLMAGGVRGPAVRPRRRGLQ